MVDFNDKQAIGTLEIDYDLFVTGNGYVPGDVIFDQSGVYVPAVKDILCIKTDDSNKHTIYDTADAALEIQGVIVAIKEDQESTPNKIITYTKAAHLHYAALGADNVTTAAHKLALVKALRAVNINTDV